MITLAAAGVVLLAVARMRHARKVFDDITELHHPAARRRAEPEPDELARARARHLEAEPKRRHG